MKTKANIQIKIQIYMQQFRLNALKIVKDELNARNRSNWKIKTTVSIITNRFRLCLEDKQTNVERAMTHEKPLEIEFLANSLQVSIK